MSRYIDSEKYRSLFGGQYEKEKALFHALDIRKFEIELYWKRAQYFWTFIAATFAGYATVVLNHENRKDLLILLSCVGLVLSFGWFLANKGSKQWQENWENHVDMLEDDVTGPLYKTVLKRPPPSSCMGCFKEMITGPGEFSVSKINQLISLYVVILWAYLLLKSMKIEKLKFLFDDEIYVYPVAAVLFCYLFVRIGKTHLGTHRHRAFLRTTKVVREK